MIILTGAAGFIGSVILSELNNLGEKDVVIVDHLATSDKWKNLRGKYFGQYFERSQFLIELKNHPERYLKATAIIHIGACSATTERDVDYLMANNVDYSRTLAEFAHSHSIRFVYASSAATYGLGEKGYSDTSDPRELLPLNPYGFSKNVFDAWLQDTLGFGWGAAGLKFFNVYGPNEYHKASMASLVVKAYEQIKNTGTIKLFKSNTPLYKDGEQQRDFIYVRDCARMVCDLITDKKNVNGILNSGTGTPRSWNDLANAVFKALNLKTSIEYVAMPAELASQYQNYTCADMSLSQSKGLLQKPISLEDGVADYVQNYLENNRAFI